MSLRSIASKIPYAGKLYRKMKPRKEYVDGGEAFHQQLQQQILHQHKAAIKAGDVLDNISDAGFRCYSQFEEDGIILYILAAIGMKTRRVVEMCCGSGSECMAANLIINHGFEGLLLDGDDISIRNANRFFASKKDCLLNQPTIRKAWITRDNVNELLSDMAGEVDVLSLDMDGIDYWVWEAIEAINPRLCVFETHNLVPGDLSITVPYDPGFNCWSKKGDDKLFRSVSLPAMVKLSKRKGYRLIGTHRHGFNAFFLREDLAPDIFPEVSVDSVHDNPWTRKQVEMWPRIKDMGWVEV